MREASNNALHACSATLVATDRTLLAPVPLVSVPLGVIDQTRGTIRLAVACVVLGTLGLVVTLQTSTPPSAWLLLPLVMCAAWNTTWLLRQLAAMAGLDEAGRREIIRKHGKHVPKRIESAAWVALAVVAAVTSLRWKLWL